MELVSISFIVLSILMLLLHNLSLATINVIPGWECSESMANTISYQTNLDNLLNSLTTNVPLRNGFHKSTEEKNSEKIYGLGQCRGDVSPADCANCTRESIKVALKYCERSETVTVWFELCFLRYSDKNFFGKWDQASVATANDTNFEDLSVVPLAISFMNELAFTTPKQGLMFQTAVLDVGKSGKRYGMAQCTRDLSRFDCNKCLNWQLVNMRTTIGNKRGWEIYGSSCSLWYHDFEFYFNVSTAKNDQSEGFSLRGVEIGTVIVLVTIMWLLW